MLFGSTGDRTDRHWSALSGWTPRFHGNCAGTVPLLGQFFKLVVI